MLKGDNQSHRGCGKLQRSTAQGPMPDSTIGCGKLQRNIEIQLLTTRLDYHDLQVTDHGYVDKVFTNLCVVLPAQDLRTPRRKHHYCLRQKLPLRGSVVPAKSHQQMIISATLISARTCTPMSCYQAARPFSKGLVGAWRPILLHPR